MLTHSTSSRRVSEIYPEFKEVSIKIDRGGLAARRMLAAMTNSALTM